MIERTAHHHTVTLRGSRFAIDVITRDATHKRAGVQIVIDDDAQGTGTRVRLHVYGQEAWEELKQLIDMADKEIHSDT